jgi:hypothetical protein
MAKKKIPAKKKVVKKAAKNGASEKKADDKPAKPKGVVPLKKKPQRTKLYFLLLLLVVTIVGTLWYFLRPPPFLYDIYVDQYHSTCKIMISNKSQKALTYEIHSETGKKKGIMTANGGAWLYYPIGEKLTIKVPGYRTKVIYAKDGGASSW